MCGSDSAFAAGGVQSDPFSAQPRFGPHVGNECHHPVIVDQTDGDPRRDAAHTQHGRQQHGVFRAVPLHVAGDIRRCGHRRREILVLDFPGNVSLHLESDLDHIRFVTGGPQCMFADTPIVRLQKARSGDVLPVDADVDRPAWHLGRNDRQFNRMAVIAPQTLPVIGHHVFRRVVAFHGDAIDDSPLFVRLGNRLRSQNGAQADIQFVVLNRLQGFRFRHRVVSHRFSDELRFTEERTPVAIEVDRDHFRRADRLRHPHAQQPLVSPVEQTFAMISVGGKTYLNDSAELGIERFEPPDFFRLHGVRA